MNFEYSIQNNYQDASCSISYMHLCVNKPFTTKQKTKYQILPSTCKNKSTDLFTNLTTELFQHNLRHFSPKQLWNLCQNET